MLVLLLWIASSFGFAQAWLRGSDGRVQWDYECHFEQLDLLSFKSEPSSRCAELCLAELSCSHWTWTSAGAGTCQLKKGATNAVILHASHLCGFVPARFSPDETQAFDLGLTLPKNREEDGRITNEEAKTAMRMFNSFRSKRGKAKLTLDARLILIANELAATVAATCREVPFTTNMEHGEGYKFFPALSASLTLRGFMGEVHAVSVAAPLDSSVKHVIEWWTSGVDTETGSKPFFSDNMTVVGFAKRKTDSCWGSRADGSDHSFGIVWTLLLAQSD